MDQQSDRTDKKSIKIRKMFAYCAKSPTIMTLFCQNFATNVTISSKIRQHRRTFPKVKGSSTSTSPAPLVSSAGADSDRLHRLRATCQIPYPVQDQTHQTALCLAFHSSSTHFPSISLSTLVRHVTSLHQPSFETHLNPTLTHP